MSEVIAVPYEKISDFEIQNSIYNTSIALNNQELIKMLNQRLLNGVINRYSNTLHDKKKFNEVYLDILDMQNTDNPNKGFLIVDSVNNGFLVRGSLLPELPLLKQNIPMPTRWAREAAKFGIPIIKQLNKTNGSLINRENISVWVTTQNLEKNKEQLASSYLQISKYALNGVWTINPVSENTRYVHEALNEAGFHQNTSFGPARYDDLESEGLQMVPISHLFLKDYQPTTLDSAS